jgi:hypothetical protein
VGAIVERAVRQDDVMGSGVRLIGRLLGLQA